MVFLLLVGESVKKINMIDPEVISIGGGLSKAFDCFKHEMFSAIKKHTLSFDPHHIMISPSQSGSESTMLGASLMVKNIKNL